MRHMRSRRVSYAGSASSRRRFKMSVSSGHCDCAWCSLSSASSARTIARILVEDLAIDADGRRRVDEQLLLNAPDAEEQLLLLVELVGPLRLPVQDVDERAPILGRLVQPRQRRRRRPRRVQVRRIEIEQALPGGARLVHVAELVLVQLGRALEELAAQRQVDGSEARNASSHAAASSACRPSSDRQPLDVAADALVGRIDAQRLAPRRQRQLPRAEPLLLQLGELRQQRRRLVPFGRLALRAEHERQLRPRLVLAIERLERLGDALAQLGPLHERLEPLARALVPPLDRERLLEQIGGADGVVEPVGVQLAAPEGQVRARLGRAGRARARSRRTECAAPAARRARASSPPSCRAARARGRRAATRDRSPGSRRSPASPPADRRARPRRDR